MSQIENEVFSPVKVNNWCKGCDICVAFCPRKVFTLSSETVKAEVTRPEKCIICGLCQLLCPDFAIDLKEPQNANG